MSRRRGWKKAVAVGAVCAVIGAVMTVAVAWGCAIWAPPSPIQPNAPSRAVSGPWPAPPPEEWPKSLHVVIRRHSHFGVTEVMASAQPDPDDRSGVIGHGQHVGQFGLPWPSMSFARSQTHNLWESRAFGLPPPKNWREGLVIPKRLARGSPAKWGWRFLPTQPVWPGFALDWAFFSALAWGAPVAPGKVRLLIRMNRGRCGACGYPIGSAPVCTECGRTVVGRIRAY